MFEVTESELGDVTELYFVLLGEYRAGHGTDPWTDGGRIRRLNALGTIINRLDPRRAHERPPLPYPPASGPAQPPKLETL